MLELLDLLPALGVGYSDRTGLLKKLDCIFGGKEHEIPSFGSMPPSFSSGTLSSPRVDSDGRPEIPPQ